MEANADQVREKSNMFARHRKSEQTNKHSDSNSGHVKTI